MRHLQFIAPAFAALAACASLPDEKVDRLPSGDSLRKAFTVREHMEGGRSWTIPTDRQLPRVDYMSRIELIPDIQKLQSLAPPIGSVLGPISAEERERIDSLKRLLEAASRAYDRNQEVLAKTQAMRAMANVGQEEVTQVHKKMLEVGQDRGRIHDHLKQWAEGQAAKKFKTDSPEFLKEVARLTDPFFLDDRGADVFLNEDRVAAFLMQEIQFAVDRANRNVERAAETAGVRLRIRAWHVVPGRGKTALHVDPYDDIEAWNGQKQPRVSLNMSEREFERFKEEYEVAKEGAKFAERVLTDRDGLRAEVRGVEEELRQSIKNVDLKLLADETVEALKSAAKRAEERAAEPEKQMYRELGALISKLKPLAEDWKKARALIESKPRGELVSILSSIRNVVEFVLQDLPKLPDQLKALSQILEKEITSRPPDTEMVSKWVEAAKNAFKPVSEFLSGQFPRLLARFTSAARANQVAESAGAVDPHVREMPLEKAQPARISLNETPADATDHIAVRAELLNGAQTMSSDWTFGVERFGLVSRFSSQLVFVDRLGHGTGGDPDVDFSPAPAASWTLHYNMRVEPEGDFGTRLSVHHSPWEHGPTSSPTCRHGSAWDCHNERFNARV